MQLLPCSVYSHFLQRSVTLQTKRKIEMKNFQTKYVAMNPSHCVACWKCVEACPKNVIGEVGFLWHKHAAFSEADACIGCKKCVKVCPHEVFFVPDSDFKVPSLWQRIGSKVRVESILFLFLLASIATGIGLHVVGHDMARTAWHGWMMAHIVSVIVMVGLSLIHIFIRRKK